MKNSKYSVILLIPFGISACVGQNELPIEYSLVQKIDAPPEQIIQAAFDSLPPVESKTVHESTLQARIAANCQAPIGKPQVTGDLTIQARDGRYKVIWSNIRFGNGAIYTQTMMQLGNDCDPAFDAIASSLYSSISESSNW